MPVLVTRRPTLGVSCANLTNYPQSNKHIGIYIAKIVQMPLWGVANTPCLRADATIGVATTPLWPQCRNGSCRTPRLSKLIGQ